MLQDDKGNSVFSLVADRKMGPQLTLGQIGRQLRRVIEHGLAKIIMGDRDIR